MPLQQDCTAVLRRPLEALVDVLHEQVHPVLVQRLHPLLDVTALEGAQHLENETFRPLLLRNQEEDEDEIKGSTPLHRFPYRMFQAEPWYMLNMFRLMSSVL